MLEWYIVVLKKYAVFSGRAGRKEYWYFWLINIFISIILSLLDSVLETTYRQIDIITTIYSIAVILPSIAVIIRRLHDIGRSGWWLLISPQSLCLGAIILAYISLLIVKEAALQKISADPGLMSIMTIAVLACLTLGGLIIFVFTCMDSQPGTNKYGPNPKNP